MTQHDSVAELLDRVTTLDAAAVDAARIRHDTLVKPAGSLGRLEELSARLAGIAGACPPPVPAQPSVVIAAADHGVHAQQVTPWPQAVTAVMVEQFCAGTAAVNAIAATVGATVTVLDVGCAVEPPDHGALRKHRIRAGTGDLSVEPAMTPGDARAALLAGADVARQVLDDGADLLVTGDMGIANTTASACLIAVFTGADAATVTGRGTGVDDDTLARKTRVVRAASARHDVDPHDPLAALAAVGGLEHAALVGVICAGAGAGVPVVLDGVVTNAAALVAAVLCPRIAGYLVASHRSTEPGATVALEHLGLQPLLDLDLRLGEGTGGLLAVPLVEAAARALRDMATVTQVGFG